MKIFPKPAKRRAAFGRFFAIVCSLAALGASAPAAPGTDLAAQLKQAEEDGATWSQIEILRRMADAEPSVADHRDRLLVLWFEVGDFDMAEQTLDASPDLPEETRAVARARIQKNRGETAAARAGLEKFLASDPRSLPATEALAELLMGAREYAALDKFLEASPLTEGNAGLLVIRASALRSAGKYPEAVAVFAKARSVGPENSSVEREAPSFERLAKAQPALEKADKALAADPADYAALVSRAFWRNYASLAGSPEDAAAALKAMPGGRAAALAAARSSGLASWEIRQKYKVISNAPELSPEAARQLAALDLAVAGGGITSLADRARFLVDAASQFLLAQEDAQEAAKANPKNAAAWFDLVRASSGADDIPATLNAAASLESLKAAKETRALAALWVAAAQFRANDLNAALESANRSISLKAFPDSYRLRASIYQRLGDATAAQADLAKAEK